GKSRVVFNSLSVVDSAKRKLSVCRSAGRPIVASPRRRKLAGAADNACPLASKLWICNSQPVGGSSVMTGGAGLGVVEAFARHAIASVTADRRDSGLLRVGLFIRYFLGSSGLCGCGVP